MNGTERPTATVDVSIRASAAPFFDPRWEKGRRAELCACGSFITVYLGNHVPEIVELHNLSTRHQQWRMGRERD